MTPEQIISETKDKASEWLQMSENPDQMMIGILAYKLSQAYDKIEHLEKRLQYECSNR